MKGDHSFKSIGEIAVFPLGMAIQDLAIFTMLGVFVVLPSFTLSRSYYIVMVYLRLYCSDVLLLWYAVLTMRRTALSIPSPRSFLRRTASSRTTGAVGRVFPAAVEHVVEVSFMYPLRVLVYILMVREWSLIDNPCARVSFQVLK